MELQKTDTKGSVELTAEIVSAYVSNNRVQEADLPALITSVFRRSSA